ncbi:hypothetical protein GYMLUDRAFT_261762 [Collybiopsis luxurians FD-317 M1]|uniref:AAA+ ATPase domain-containing protein n=1 Tax=Collybiopsis luxurians FD-317 M1 TaxID=944289 RepID=A0A0D0BW18_9AGAR|nr:hypothetical protein GYMLUDRAFT_261762 [Collybiopsis luxurians FD-317 M1]
MRSQHLLRRSRALLRTNPVSLYSSALPSRSPKKPSSKRLFPHSPARCSSTNNNGSQDSSVPSSQVDPPAEESSSSSKPSPIPPPEDPDKSKGKRGARFVSSSSKDQEIQFPEDLHILWNPDELPAEPLNPESVPPPEILDEVLHKLLVTLHPQTQHRAAYPPPLTPSVEPTLALYCPLEGGEYVIDSTVVELARRTGSEVLVLDAVQLAAGEWGYFGPAANSLKLPRNPLHFASSATAPSKSPSPSSFAEEEDESEYGTPHQMMFTVLAPSNRGSSPTVIKPKRPAPPSKVKVFFDSLVNLPSVSSKSGQSTSRPRLIYIRDFPTLASTSSAWFPYLRDAVNQKRKGPITRSASPVPNPITIIFGMSPPLSPPPERPIHPGGSSILSVLMNRSVTPMHSPLSPRSERTDWTESPAAEQAREKRLQQRLKNWEKGEDIVMDEYLKHSDEYSDGNRGRKSDIMVVEGPGSLGSGIVPFPMSLGSSNPAEDVERLSFFRSSVLVPRVRSVTDERDFRVLRRREINELTMRMALGAIGGVIEEDGSSFKPSFAETPTESGVTSSTGSSSPSSAEVGLEGTDPVPLSSLQERPASAGKRATQMWEAWGRQLEPWSNVRQVADRVMGNVMASREGASQSTLERTAVSWSDVHRGWDSVRGTFEHRKTWLKDSSPSTRKTDDEEEVVKIDFDEVIERVKNDPDLDPHEQRLLPSIVDAATMSTSFSQVHLPPHTIDSIRSIVSLPLLHPGAFQSGILKQHGMTGCLLFGPPGTGKTLVVRALAKEAGCRMMVISPSDVMDMYVGEGEKLVHAVFSLARKLAPCVIFLDEIDALFSARQSMRETGGAFAHRGIITEFMQEMDGLKTSRDDNVIVIGATNRPFDLDDAVLRRLPRRLLVDLPGIAERQEILKILLRDEIMGEDLDLAVLAKQTESFSGSDLKHLCVSAALDAVKENIHLPWQILPAEGADTPTKHGQVTKDANANANLGTENDSEKIQAEDASAQTSDPPLNRRTISRRHFDKALKEITPSSSESLGSLADLRKWNEEFGEGRKDRKHKLVWGRGRFGFTTRDTFIEEGRVVPSNTLPSSGDAGSGT